MAVNKTDVIAELGVRTKKSPREGQPGPTGGVKANKRPKISARDQKGFGSDQKNAPKTPSKNTRVGAIMNAFQSAAKNDN